MPAPLHVITVFGTRPEAVKLAPVIHELRRQPNAFRVTVAVTGQHRELLDQFLRCFDIAADVDLNLMTAAQSVTQVTARALAGLEAVLADYQPEIVLVQGDTATVFAAALAAFYQQIPVGHVEAGLRSGNVYEPFPEEALRRMTTVVSTLHFAPTAHARAALLRDGVDAESVFVTGNTVVDALHSILPSLPVAQPAAGRTILVTAHRRENLGAPMVSICHALLQLLERFPDVRIVFPVHPNPAVRQVVFGLLDRHQRIELREPADYLEFLTLMRDAHLIISDSGGVQEEAPVFGKPVLVLRRTTERPEGIAAGVSALVGTKTATIVEHASRLLSDRDAYAAMSRPSNPYGDGLASQRIEQALRFHFGRSDRRPEDWVPDKTCN